MPRLRELEKEANRAYHEAEHAKSNRDDYLQPFLAPLGIQDGDAVVDLGCGVGYISFHLDRKLPLKRNVALEFNRDTIRQAREGTPNTDGRVTWVCASAESVPLRSSSFERVICRGVLPLADVPNIVREIARLLKSGGTTVILAHSWRFYLPWLSVDPRRWKYTAAGLLSLFQGLWLNVTGWQLHFRLSGKPIGQTFQTERLISRLGAEVGLDVFEVRRTDEFLLYLRKR